jgi:hypothetical protein
VVPSLDQATSESYVWAHPGCPVRILLSLNVIRELQDAIAQAAQWPGEIGGLLICAKQSERRTVRIIDFIPLTGEADLSGSPFQLSSESLAEAVARCPSDSRIGGYYRTDMYQSVLLRPEDVETIEQFFREPTSIFLVIAPTGTHSATAGFFFWENGAVAANPTVTFPFSASQLVAEGWQTQPDSAEKGKLAGFSRRLWQVAEIYQSASLMMIIGVISALMALTIGIFAWNRYTGQSRVVSPPSLGLQVKRDGMNFLVTWNPDVPEIANAKDANLAIWDGSRHTSDGHLEALYIPLTSTQLRSGNVTYTSFGFKEKIKFRLEAAGAAGIRTSESTVLVSPAFVENSPPLPSVTTRESMVSISVPLPPPAVARHPAQETTPRGRLDTNTIPTKKFDPAPFPTLINRIFIPPRSITIPRAAGDAMLPDPPYLLADLTAGERSGFRPEFPPNAVAVIPPPEDQSNGRAPLSTSLLRGAAVPLPNDQSNEGVITITSDPSGARVEINALPAGVTPLAVQISPLGLGFTVTVTKNGYRKWIVQTFSTAQPSSLHAALSQIPK